jgi:hypothetical protein
MPALAKLLIFSISVFAVVLPFARADQASGPPASATAADGQHDFDFNIGVWHTHIRRLKSPLSGTSDWMELNGTVTVRKVWDGKAQLEEIEADGAGVHFEGTTLFLYDPTAHQWRQYFASSDAGTLEVPSVGEFKNGRGEFYDQESYRGRSILARGIWSNISPNSHRYEQAYSQDGGKTWETNFVADLTRIKPAGS